MSNAGHQSEPVGHYAKVVARRDKPGGTLKTKLIVGCGYLGERVAKLWRAANEEVYVVTRSVERAKEFSAEGMQPLVANILDPQSLGNLPQVDTVLFAVGYDRQSATPIEEVYNTGLANVLAALPAGTGRLIYISTTGIYGPSGGELVDETTPPAPQRAGGRGSHMAEATLASHPLGKKSVILRLAGIYGPNRVPYIDKLRAGEPLAVPNAGWLNLIHVDDAAVIVLASEKWATANPKTDGPQIFCVSDGQPVIRGIYYREVARQIGAAEPQFIAPKPDTPAAARARSDKRISNRKMIKELGTNLHYPSYREGLAAILNAAP